MKPTLEMKPSPSWRQGLVAVGLFVLAAVFNAIGAALFAHSLSRK